MYKSLFLPVDKPLEDGCDCVNSLGEHFTYHEVQHFSMRDHFKRAELFLVDYRFNQMIVVGRPSHEAIWLRNGTMVKEVDCEQWYWNANEMKWEEYIQTGKLYFNIDHLIPYWRILCPTCQKLH